MSPTPARSIPSLTVRENLRMAFRYTAPKGEVEDRIKNVLELFPALGRHVSTRAGSLSGGEQQMVALAPAIVIPPSSLWSTSSPMGSVRSWSVKCSRSSLGSRAK